MQTVKAKKHLGQHFLKDENIAEKIADTLPNDGFDTILEIGPGMGVLTKYLLTKSQPLHLVEIDNESVVYLSNHYPDLTKHIHREDFLKMNLENLFPEQQLAVIGNFPYNISTQIVFKTLESRNIIPVFAGMFQKEVAARIASKPGSKVYGILSVLVQAFYDVEYLFTVSEQVFNPPPKVKSGVIRLTRKQHFQLDCDEILFFKVVKTAFQQRRKTLRNSLKIFELDTNSTTEKLFSERPERLGVAEFVALTHLIEHSRKI
ncbi:MAG: 16S rRNA (adenine(1518)-N(6)/adenine(1519)-N(6))-dimethyltransferase RsmA [Flavobacteriaceae bacterium]|nr:16S rRNA (adenine(1518)-N(6)/adenine(1519)-N(6))-dimethyltransferase RsmA [Flavobacteriaceae bacterium]